MCGFRFFSIVQISLSESRIRLLQTLLLTVRTTVQDSRSSKCMNGAKRGGNYVAKKTKNKDGTIFNTVQQNKSR